ncbi:MAG: protein kinase domain-containing protein [Terriglobia bacterium]
MIGQTVSHYRILEKLGGGGMGVVYKAEDTRLGRMVALKFLPKESAQGPKSIERFQREAYAASALDHPNICSVFEIGEYKGEPFIVMQYFAGQSLQQKLGRRRPRTSSFERRERGAQLPRDSGEHEGTAKPLKTSEILDLGIQIADALDAAHSKGILHRDIKPANIFLTERGQAKLLDFGLAKLVTGREANEEPTGDSPTSDEPLTNIGEVVGTVEYMSPEQVRSEELDGRTDLFSLGLVLYEMAAGQQAFSGDSLGAVVNAILHRIPPSPRLFNPDLPPKFEEIISKAIEKDRTLRYQTASDMRADLQRLKRDLESERGRVLPVVADHGSVWKRRGWVAVGIAPLGLVVIALLLVGLNVDNWRDRLLGRAPAPRIESLAVLPLENLSRDPEQGYFADGMTEALITDLASVAGLRVISRNSAMRYKDSSKPIQVIARELKVDAVVEGSVLRSGGRVRITAQLVQAATDRNLWASMYERDVRDVLALQSEVAQAIVDEIRIKLSPQEATRLRAARSVKPDAYEAYLKGRYFWNRRDREGVTKGLQYFQQAVELEPNYALAYAGISDSYLVLGGNYWLSPHEAFPAAKAAALKAVEIDDSISEAHTSLAQAMELDWDWKRAEREYKQALALNPGYATAHQWFSAFLSNMGRREMAIQEAMRAAELDPLSPVISLRLAQAFYFARRYREAKGALQRTFEVSPDFFFARELLGVVDLQDRKFEESIAELQAAARLSPGDDETKATLGFAYALSGRKREAQAALDELKEQSRRKYVSPRLIALVCVALDKKGEAFEWLGKAYEQRDSELPEVGVEPMFDPLRSDPRFHDLLRRMNLPT